MAGKIANKVDIVYYVTCPTTAYGITRSEADKVKVLDIKIDESNAPLKHIFRDLKAISGFNMPALKELIEQREQILKNTESIVSFKNNIGHMTGEVLEKEEIDRLRYFIRQ